MDPILHLKDKIWFEKLNMVWIEVEILIIFNCMINLIAMHIQRFFSYLSLFTFFMLILITGDNLLIVFVGWEGVGICSYLLINFWFRRLQANKAAIQAILMNRIGDWGYSIGLFSCFAVFGNIDFYIIFSLASKISTDLLFVACLAFLLAAMGKSAQIGL